MSELDRIKQLSGLTEEEDEGWAIEVLTDLLDDIKALYEFSEEMDLSSYDIIEKLRDLHERYSQG